MTRKTRTTRRRGRGEAAPEWLEDVQLWRVRIELDPGPNGKRRRKSVYARTKEEVLKERDRVKQKVKGGSLAGEEMTLATCLDYWLDGRVKPRVDAGTYALHKQRVDDSLIPHLGHVKVARLTAFLVTHLYQTLEKEGRSADLRNKVGQLLRRCLDHAVRLKLAADNAARLVDLPRVTSKEMHPLDEAQVKTFLASALGNRLYPLYLLALDTGMREGEIIALEWPDVDFTTGMVSITKSARWEKGGVRIKEEKTKASRRRIHLTHQTLDALAAWRSQTPGQLVFPARKKPGAQEKYLNPSNLLRALRLVLQKAELSEIRFHDLRHTHATLALLRTRNIVAVARRLGHKDIRTTLRVYAHWLPVMADEYVATMENLLTPQPLAEKQDTSAGPHQGTVRVQSVEEDPMVSLQVPDGRGV